MAIFGGSLYKFTALVLIAPGILQGGGCIVMRSTLPEAPREGILPKMSGV